MLNRNVRIFLLNPADHETVAIHEAGHAVMCLLVGNWIREGGITVDMTVDPVDATPDIILGRCDIRAEALPTLDFAQWAYKEGGLVWEAYKRQVRFDVLTNFAGPVAEARHAKRQIRGVLLPDPADDTTDMSRAWRLMRILSQAEGRDPTDEMLCFHAWCPQNETKKVIRRPRVWSAIRAIAAALLAGGGHLSGDDAEKIVAGICRPSDRLHSLNRICAETHVDAA
ncbi:MAG: hypothetical protein ACRC67_12110 [Inquilinus sp.]|uniref:hypothetical protein n=1 Tax=Inquilinus sp. TaxID=1932117 RepID=UPI003F3A1EB2